MFLILSAIFLSLCLVLSYIANWASRAPEGSIWSADMTIGAILVPALIGFGAIGAVLLVRFFQSLGTVPLSLIQVIWSLGIVAVAVFAASLLHRRLRRLPKLEDTATILHPASAVPDGAAGPTDSSPRDKGKVA